MNASLDDLVNQVRKELDEVTLVGEEIEDDTDLADTFSSNFSDESIKDRLLDGTRYIAARVQANYLHEFIIEVRPPDFNLFNDNYPPKILRLLGSTVQTVYQGNAVSAVRRTFSKHLKTKKQRGLVASVEYPVYVFQDFELLITAEASLPDNSKTASAVRVPDSHSDILLLPSKFRGAVVQYATYTCLETLGQQDDMKNAKARLDQEIRQYRLPMRNEGSGQNDEDSE